MTCCKIGYVQIGKCGDRNLRYMICTELHKLKDHSCKVNGCHKRKRKVCFHAKVKYTNCGEGHCVHSNQCTQRYKAKVDAKRNKLLSKDKAEINKVCLNLRKASFKFEASPKPNTNLKPKPILA